MRFRAAVPLAVGIALVLALPALAEKGKPSNTKPASSKTAAAKPAVAANPSASDTLAMLEKTVAKDSSDFDTLYRLGVLSVSPGTLQRLRAVMFPELARLGSVHRALPQVPRGALPRPIEA